MDRLEGTLPYDLDRLIKGAKKRLKESGEEVTSLNIYRMVTILRKEELKEFYGRTRQRENG